MNVLVYIVNIVITTGHQHCLKTMQPVPEQHNSDLFADQGLYYNNLMHFFIGYFLLSLIIVAPVDQPPIITGEKC